MNVEKTMQFILEHEAKHEVEIQQLRQEVRQTNRALSKQIQGLAKTQARQQQILYGVVAMVGDFARQVSGLSREVDRLARENRKTAQLQRRDHIDLKALTKIVDKLVRRNGRGRR